MQQEYNTDNLYKYRQHTIHLACGSHIEEDTKDIYRQKRDNHRLDGHRDNLLKLLSGTAQHIVLDIRQAQAHNESHNKCRHYIHHGRNIHRKEWRNLRRLTSSVELDLRIYK